MTRRGKGPGSQRAWFAERGVPKTCNYGPDVHQAVPPAASQPPAGEVCVFRLPFCFFLSFIAFLVFPLLYLCRPVRASFFLLDLFILLSRTFARSFFCFLFSFVFSFVLSVHFERPPASTPTAVHLI